MTAWMCCLYPSRAKKPLLWEQGSLLMPLVLYDERGTYPVFPFRPKAMLKNCHLAIISKPGLPLTADVTGQNPNTIFGQQQPPPYYCARNATTWITTCAATPPCCAT